MNHQRAITAFYLNVSIREMIPIYPLFAIMFGEHGISPMELSLLFSIWALIGIVTEVPSGALADTFSRKWLIVASGLIKGSAFFTWYLWQDFYGYALGFILWGLGSSLRSGAWEALLHDILKDQGSESLFTRHYGRLQALGTTGVVIGELLGGLLIINGYDFVLLISTLIPIIASVIFMVMVTDPPVDEAAYEAGYMVNLRNGAIEAVNNRSILYILLVSTFLILASGVYDEYMNPVMFEHLDSLAVLAFLSAAVALAEALGFALADRFSFLSLDQLLVMMGTSTLSLFFIGPLGGYWVAVLLAIFFAMFGIATVQFAGQLQQQIEGSARATVTSVVGLGQSVGAIIWFMVFGSMAEVSGMTTATHGFAIITIVSCAIFFVLGRVWKITHDSPLGA